MIFFKYLLYYLVIIPISLLPFPLLYLLSDFIFFLFYYVINYRKKVIFTNIQNSFPQMSSKEQKEICRKFYKHFCDLILESIKTFTISDSQVKKRVVFKNPELMNNYYDKGRSIIIAGGHYNNWELFAVAFDDLIKHHAVGIYKPLNDKFFNDKLLKTRSKYGLQMLSTKKVKHFFEENKNMLSAVIFAIDQSPSNPKSAYWMKFLNQDTGVLFGAEKYAVEYNYVVLYGRINKEKRGYYSFEMFDVSDEPTKTGYGEITRTVTELLEKDILKQPEYWLWSHRRWKHKKPE